MLLEEDQAQALERSLAVTISDFAALDFPIVHVEIVVGHDGNLQIARQPAVAVAQKDVAAHG